MLKVEAKAKEHSRTDFPQSKPVETPKQPGFPQNLSHVPEPLGVWTRMLFTHLSFPMATYKLWLKLRIQISLGGVTKIQPE